jgi:hypothetical protein
MENALYYSGEEFQKCPFHSQQNNDKNYVYAQKAEKAASESLGKPDQSGTDPNRYNPDKFEKAPNADSGGDGSTESTAEELNKL